MLRDLMQEAGVSSVVPQTILSRQDHHTNAMAAWEPAAAAATMFYLAKSNASLPHNSDSDNDQELRGF